MIALGRQGKLVAEHLLHLLAETFGYEFDSASGMIM